MHGNVESGGVLGIEVPDANTSSIATRNDQSVAPFWHSYRRRRRRDMGGLIYLVGLIVIILFILSFLGLR
jgi:hypothetical protein